MINQFLAVVWDVSPTFLSIGSFEIRWYGLCWAIAFALGMWFFANVVKREKLSPKVLDSIIIYAALGCIIGARLGHCFFYEWRHYLANPWEILFIWQGGLASHGAALGLLAGLWLFSRKRKLPYVWSLDRIMVPVAIGGAFVRLGNLMNSEIYGIQTDRPWGFIFVNAGETVPKHPTQIYEALSYFVIFLILMWLYYRRDAGRRRPGVMFGVGLIGIFLSRFFIEYIKNPQEEFEQGMSLLMGQWLSIPFVLLGIFMIVWAYRRKPAAPEAAHETGAKVAGGAHGAAGSQGTGVAAKRGENHNK